VTPLLLSAVAGGAAGVSALVGLIVHVIVVAHREGRKSERMDAHQARLEKLEQRADLNDREGPVWVKPITDSIAELKRQVELLRASGGRRRGGEG
jgi:hypothetical protein